LHRREREDARPRPDREEHPADGQHEPVLEHVAEHTPDDLKIERAHYESTHSSSHADGGAAPHNGVATNDKKHTSGELKSVPDESNPDDDSPDHQKN
jgi:hypothetical protein